MPSTAFGPLVEPAATYPGAAQPPDLGRTFVNAFAIGSEINRRKQQLENQMAAMALRQQQNEITNQLRESEFERKLDQGNQRLEMAQAGQNLRDSIFNWKVAKDQETMDDISGAAQGLGAINLDAADPKRPSAIWDVIQHNARAAKAMPSLFKDAFNNYNTAARTVQSKYDHDYRDFIQDVKNTVGKGQITDLNLIYNLDQWKSQWRNKEGQNIDPATADPKKGDYKTGNVFATIPSSIPGAPSIFVTLPAQQITDLHKRMIDLSNRRRNIPSQVSNEYVSPQTGSVDEKPLPLPASKSDLQVGKDYDTAKGTATWNGNEFIPK